jgi:hypothetical protein
MGIPNDVLRGPRGVFPNDVLDRCMTVALNRGKHTVLVLFLQKKLCIKRELYGLLLPFVFLRAPFPVTVFY